MDLIPKPAKVIGLEKKKGWFVLVWDGIKFRLSTRRASLAIAILVAFILGFGCVTSLNRSTSVIISEITTPSLYDIPAASDLRSNALTPNKQSRKVPKKTTFSGPQIVAREIIAIPPGTLVKAKLITGASDGPVRAELLEDIVVRGERLVTSGCLLMGSGTSTDERLFIRFDRLIKKDASVLPFQAQALDATDRIVGLKGNRLHSELTKLGAGIGLNFVGGLSQGLQETENKGGVAVKSSSLKNALLNGAAIAALDQSRDLITSAREKAPRIEVEPGKRIWIMTE